MRMSLAPVADDRDLAVANGLENRIVFIVDDCHRLLLRGWDCAFVHCGIPCRRGRRSLRSRGDLRGVLGEDADSIAGRGRLERSQTRRDRVRWDLEIEPSGVGIDGDEI